MKKAHFDYFLKILCFGRPWFLLLSVYCVALLFGMVSSANAKIYYVSKQGYDIPSNVDSPGPDSNACLTVMYLIDNTSLQGGDIVYIQEGIYDEHIVITSADDGTEGLYVTFKSYENDTVILIDTVYDSNDYAIVEIGNHPTNTARYIMWDGSGTDNGHHIIIDGNNTAQRCMQLRNACNIWLKNIEMKDASNPSYKRECLKLLSWQPDTKSGGVDDDKGCKNCLIEYCAFHGGGDYGIKVTGWGTDNNIFRYNMIYNNGSADGESNYGVNQSGNYYNSNPPTGNTWHDNEFYNNYSNGLQILVGPNTKIYNNKIYNNGQGVSSGKGLALSAESDGCEVFSNEIYGNAYYGIAVAGSSNSRYYNNLIYSNGGEAEIMVQTHSGSGETSDNNRFLNNTIHEDARNYFPIYIKQGNDNIIKNNIFYSDQFVAFRAEPETTIVESNSIYRLDSPAAVIYNGKTYSVPDFNVNETNAKNNIYEDPQWNSEYRLTEYTPAGLDHIRDGGLDFTLEGFSTDIQGIFRPQGSGWDIGAYEYVTGIPVAGDLNDDGTINVQDLQLCVNVILGIETDPDIVSRADVGGDSNINVIDTQEIVNTILNQSAGYSK